LISATGIFAATSAMTVVNVALPFITKAFQSDVSTSQWVLLSYLLTTSSLLINAGRLGDILGPFRMHQAGLLILITSSFFCALSRTEGMLVTFRIFEGLGGAMIISNGPGAVTSFFPPRQRGKVLGLLAGIVGTSLSVGPAIAGFLVEVFGWRSIFIYNVPIGILGLVLGRFVPALPRETGKVNIDIAGGLLLFLFIVSFVLGLDGIRRFGWSSPAVLFLSALFLLCLSGFILAERTVRHPMLDLRLFRNPTFALAQAGNFLGHMSTMGVFFLMPFYLVGALKVSAQASGLILLPLTVMMVVIGPASGYFSDHLGTKWPAVCGMVLTCLGLFSLTSLAQDTSILGVMLRLALLGAGRAVYQSPNFSAAMGSVRKDYIGVAGGVYAATRYLGSLSGIAVVGSYFSARQASYLQRESPGDSIGAVPFLAALQDTFLLSLGIAALGFLTALFEKELNAATHHRP